MLRAVQVVLVLALGSLGVATDVLGDPTFQTVVVGKVVKCPDNSPSPDTGVWIWANGVLMTQATTLWDGTYSAQIELPWATNTVTVTIGSALDQPYTEDYCPTGSIPGSPPCCRQRAKTWSGFTGGFTMPDLELRQPKKPGEPDPTEN